MLFRIVFLLSVCFSWTVAVGNLVTQTLMSPCQRDELGFQNVDDQTLIDAFGTIIMNESSSPNTPILGPTGFEYFGETYQN